jgi:hypothetical protein
MKKICIIALLAGICGYAQATVVSYANSITITPSGGAIDGANAYEWLVNLGSGVSVTGAEIDINNITLTSVSTGKLYTDLLNSHHATTSVSDGDAAGDYWGTQFSGANISQIGNANFVQNVTQNPVYTLTTGQVSSLNSYLASNGGSFDLGIDPDCHYTVSSIVIKYNTSSIPDISATAFLLALGLLTVEIFRRKVVVAKVQS